MIGGPLPPDAADSGSLRHEHSQQRRQARPGSLRGVRQPVRPERAYGFTEPLLSEDAVALIHQVSRGLPRAVNNLATQALVAAYSTGKSIVDESCARAAVSEVDAE